jgi:HJR/Mrr/RecB family endonuclease
VTADRSISFSFLGEGAAMRVVGFAVLLYGASAIAAPKPYWICVDEHGNKSASDLPCPANTPIIRAPVTAERNVPQPHASIPVSQAQPPVAATHDTTRQPVSAISALQRTESHQRSTNQLLQPLVSTIEKGLGWLVVILALIFIVKIGFALLVTAAKKKVYSAAARHLPVLAPKWIGSAIEAVAPLITAASREIKPPSKQPTAKPTEWSLQLLQTLEWKRFEILCRELWRLKGYKADLTCTGADGGVDIMISEFAAPDNLYAIAQCKSWISEPVGVAIVRELWGVRHHMNAEHAVLLTLAGFTPEARAFAIGKQLQLIAGDQLLQQIGDLLPEQRQALLLQVTEGDYTTPTCSHCDIKMVERKTRSGGRGWGCSNFPRCRQWLNGRIPRQAAA